MRKNEYGHYVAPDYPFIVFCSSYSQTQLFVVSHKQYLSESFRFAENAEQAIPGTTFPVVARAEFVGGIADALIEIADRLDPVGGERLDGGIAAEELRTIAKLIKGE